MLHAVALLPAFVAVALTLAAAQPACPSMLDVVSIDPQLSTLAALIGQSGLAPALSDPEAELTLFAPNNKVFNTTSALTAREMDNPKGVDKVRYELCSAGGALTAQCTDCEHRLALHTLPCLLHDACLCLLARDVTGCCAGPQVLKLHVVPVALSAADLFAVAASGSALDTLLPGNALRPVVLGTSDLSIKDGIGGNPVVVHADISACKSVVHVIDGVLVPDPLAKPAPRNGSEAAEPGEPSEVVELAPGPVAVDAANATAAEPGEPDGVEEPAPGPVAVAANTTAAANMTAAANATAAAQPACPSIFDVVSSDPQLSMLAALVGQTNLAAALSDPKAELTLFAPRDDGFAALSPVTLRDLEVPENLSAVRVELHVPACMWALLHRLAWPRLLQVGFSLPRDPDMCAAGACRCSSCTPCQRRSPPQTSLPPPPRIARSTRSSLTRPSSP